MSVRTLELESAVVSARARAPAPAVDCPVAQYAETRACVVREARVLKRRRNSSKLKRTSAQAGQDFAALFKKLQLAVYKNRIHVTYKQGDVRADGSGTYKFNVVQKVPNEAQYDTLIVYQPIASTWQFEYKHVPGKRQRFDSVALGVLSLIAAHSFAPGETWSGRGLNIASSIPVE